MKSILETFRIPEDEPIEDKMFSSAIEKAQKRVEENNFGIRKRLLDYDQVMNEQRETIYAERRRVLEGDDLRNEILDMIDTFIGDNVSGAAGGNKNAAEWQWEELQRELCSVIPYGRILPTEDELPHMTEDKLIEQLKDRAYDLYMKKEEEIGSERMREVERMILLQTVDRLWMEHIDIMDQMRQGIGLQAFANRNPLDEYRIAAYDMFEDLNHSIREKTLRGIYTIHIVENQEVERKEVAQNISTNRGQDTSAVKKPVKRVEKKVGRNDPCPCGSGLKYKNCCGRNA